MAAFVLLEVRQDVIGDQNNTKNKQKFETKYDQNIIQKKTGAIKKI